MDNLSILLIDDEISQLTSLKSFLSRRNHTIYTAENGNDALDIIHKNLIDVALTDFRMPGMNGLEVLKEIKMINPEIEVVVTTAYGNIDQAVDIMKSGAYDYLTKPIDLDELENLLFRIKEKKNLLKENKYLREQLKEKFKFDSIISQSGKMEDVLNLVGRVANSKATALIKGESGTGKELIAKALHFASSRKDNPFITVNVAALSENLMESELFGHEKGSFTGAIAKRIGRFEEANKGTLFIDEIGDIPLNIQVKLLRAIQFGEIQRIGSNNTEKIDVRIIGATNRNLEEMIEQGEFREDLFYRLNVVSVDIPPLRERKEDIPLLIEHFIKKYSQINSKEVSKISHYALDKLLKYHYPGNIRELENIIERSVILARSDMIEESDLPLQLEAQVSKSLLNPHAINKDYDEKIHAFEAEIIRTALEDNNGNQSAAARYLGITERHLRSRLERLGLKNNFKP
jgi:two-component system NtrC family response regulator